MGPSGSGKSTLMHILAGLDKPTSGSVGIAGTEITTLGDNDLTKLRREHIGFVFQFFNLLPMLDAKENILLPLTIAGEKPDERRGSISSSRTSGSGIGCRIARRSSPAASSSASRSRARSSRGRPCSSPTSRPATSTRRRAGRSSSSCAARSTSTGQTIVMVTHDSRAAAIAHRVLFLADGVIVRELGECDSHEILTVMEEVAAA